MYSKTKYILTLLIIWVSFYIQASDLLEKFRWKVDFNNKGDDGQLSLPEGWEIRTQISTKATHFKVSEEKGTTYLQVNSNNSTGTLICKMEKVDLRKTPILSWKWRANILPKSGDGRLREKDDQACGIYIGTGNLISKKSVSYRWDTDTPIDSKGEISYALGSIKVKWHTLKNKKSKLGRWYIEERNIAEDFKTAWGFIPDEIYLSICGNSQYTKTKGSVDIDWIKLKSKTLPNPQQKVKQD